jgi:hypothetical protein
VYIGLFEGFGAVVGEWDTVGVDVCGDFVGFWDIGCLDGVKVGIRDAVGADVVGP